MKTILVMAEVEDLYEVKIGTVCLTLCKKCLLELVEKSLMVTKNKANTDTIKPKI